MQLEIESKKVKTVNLDTRIGTNIQLYVNGSKKAFSCPRCAANVFTKFPRDQRYYCNGCPATYLSK